jgi:EmrB/QacA subfamily drug resistance transporter
METPPVGAEAPGTPPNFAAGERVRLRGWALASVLASLMLTLFLAALDSTIVNTALPKILRDINGYDRYTWPIIAYLLTSTMMVPIMGKLSDQFGRKWFLITGVIVFLAGSALSGASKEFATLFNADPMNVFILFRAIQGIGGGTLFGLVFTLVGDVFTPVERAKWQGLFTAVFGLSSVFGPTAGGYLSDTYGWQWIFYINLPLGLLALFLLFSYLPSNISPRSTQHRGWAGIRRIDFTGAFLAAGATVCLVLGLSWGGGEPPNGFPWDSPQVVGVLTAAGALLILFLLNEAFLAKEPILPLDLFKNQVFAAGALLALGVGMALFAVALYLPLFIQDVMGKSATESGLLVTPLTVALAITAIFGGQAIARVGRYQWLALIGALVMSGGMYLMTQLTGTSDITEVTRDMVVVGLGMGMVQPVMTTAVQNAIPRMRLGTGTGAVTYLRSMGSLLGVAIVGTVATNTYSQELGQRLDQAGLQLPPHVTPIVLQRGLGDPNGFIATAQAQAAASVPPGPAHDQIVAGIAQQIRDALTPLFGPAREALTVGIQDAFWVALLVCAAIFVVTFFLKDVPLGQRAPVAAAQLVRNTELNEAAAFNGEALPGAAFGFADGGGAMVTEQRLAPALVAQVPIADAPIAQEQDLAALTWSALGLTLASLARQAGSPDADPRLLAALSDAVDGRYPHGWSTQQRAQALAHDTIAPLAQALVSAYTGATLNGTGTGQEQAAAYGSGAAGSEYGNSRANGHGYTSADLDAGPYHNGNGGQPSAVSAVANGAYSATVEPRKKVRVTRRLVVDGHIIGEHTLEDLVPVDADTEAAAEALRARLDALAPTPRPDDVPTLQQFQPGSNGSLTYTRRP